MEEITANALAELAKANIKVQEEEEKLKERQKPFLQFQTPIVWFNAVGFLVLHLLGIYGFFWTMVRVVRLDFSTFSWNILLGVLGGQGVTMGAHRLWSHKAFKAKLPLEIILIILQTLSGQNCLYVWVRDHRQHHKYSDTDADPHNSKRGFFFSHIGWLMMKKHPEVISKGKTIDMSDLEMNRIVMFQKKYYKSLYFLIAIVVPVWVPIYFWNEDFYFSLFLNFFTRVITILNITWCVNSVAHFYGYRPFNRYIRPVESNFTAFITLGEGWHNYHHSFPWDYKASELGSAFNLTRILIELAAKVGWAYDLRTASQEVVQARANRLGDSHYKTRKSHDHADERATRAAA